MDESSVDDFLPKPPPASRELNVPAKCLIIKKKRKRSEKVEDDAEELVELKKKAKFFCRCPEQWTTVNKMSKPRMKDWVAEKEYEKQAELYSTVTDFAHEMFAMVFDKLSRGDGYVESELKADQSLKECLRNELGSIVSYLTNRWRLGALTMIDVTNAKRRQLIENPPLEPEIIEEINGNDIENQDSQSSSTNFMEQQSPNKHGYVYAEPTSSGEEEKDDGEDLQVL
jgi:hypothetical protein